MIYIGIDPGRNGAIALLGNSPESTVVYPYSAENFIKPLRSMAAAWQFSEEKVIACVEHVNAMPGQGVVSMFNFGQNFGYIRGMLEALQIPYELVRPQKWKKEFSITGKKNSSIEVCKRLFPDVSLRRTDRCRKDDDNMAEALLLAEYARRRF